eukprot:scaffold300907_cov14-Tisochrysis_lutea.AAC.2
MSAEKGRQQFPGLWQCGRGKEGSEMQAKCVCTHKVHAAGLEHRSSRACIKGGELPVKPVSRD